MNPMNFTDPFGKSIREILKLQFAYYEYLMDVKGWSEEAAHKEARNQSQILIARWKMSLEMKHAIKDLAYENFRKNLYCGAPVANLDELKSIYNYISNFGTRTGEAISNWLRNKDFENFLIMATTAWGEAGEAFLAVIGGLRGYQSLRAQYQSIQRLDARFEAFVKGKYGQFKDWYKLNKNRLQSGHIGNKFDELTINDIIMSSSRSRNTQITEGARAIAKKIGHARKGGYKSAFEGIEAIQENANKIIREILSDPKRTFIGTNVIDVYDSLGRGVRFEKGTNKFIGFLEEIISKQ